MLEFTPIVQFPCQEAYETMCSPAVANTAGGAGTGSGTETRTFYWNASDTDSGQDMARTVEYDANGLLKSATVFSVTNAPTITTVVSDQTPNTNVLRKGVTTLTITGTNYGAEDDDLEVLVWVTPKAVDGLGPHPTNRTDGRQFYKADITAVNAGDTEITATIEFEECYGYRVVATGPCYIEVRNIKRKLKSSQFQMTVV